ncbi:MAG: hypothetical protein ABL951_06975 [Alphaproteobacteria bacterium]
MIIERATGVIVSLAPATHFTGGWRADGIVYGRDRFSSVDAAAPAHVTPGAWRYVNGGFRPVDSTPDELAAEQDAMLRRVRKIATARRDAMLNGAHPMEVQGWIAKAAEAAAFAADPGDDLRFPIIKQEAEARGVTPDALVAKITAKRTALIRAEAAIEGARGRHKDAIRAITSMSEIEAYDINSGWAGEE